MKGHVLRRLKPHLDTITKLYADGSSFEDIAKLFDCAPSTIRRLLISEEIPLRGRVKTFKLDPVEAEIMSAHEAGETLEIIAKRHQVQRDTVVRFLVAKALNLGGERQTIQK